MTSDRLRELALQMIETARKQGVLIGRGEYDARADKAQFDAHCAFLDALDDHIAEAIEIDRDGFLKQKAALLTALQEIADGRGRFSTDPYEHACNVIEEAVATAKTALANSRRTGPFEIKRRLAEPGECKTCDEYRAKGETMFPSHQASDRCESGKRPHCTCSACW